MKLEVGIFENKEMSLRRSKANRSVGWKIVCDQEKVPFHITDQPDAPVMVFDGELPVWLEDYLSAGGSAVITDARPDSLPFDANYSGDASIEFVDLTELGAGPARVQCITALYPGAGVGKITVHENRIKKYDLYQDEFPVFLYHPLGKGGCWYTGLPFSRLMGATGDTLRKSTDFSDYSERITSIDRHSIAKALQNVLVRAFHAKGLPYVHLWYYPGNYQSAFAFRIDVDGVHGDLLGRVSRAARHNGFALTFFVNKSLCQEEAQKIREIDPVHEIGNHADVHNLFSDYSSNYQNILRCKEWLDEIGIQQGPWFAAPRGMWNEALHQALEDLEYLYTSDFGVCIEGFPFFPYIANARSKVLQIPVNPFSVERAWVWKAQADAGAVTPDFVSSFWNASIEKNYQNDLPVILYSHPEKFGAIADEVFPLLRQKLTGLKIWETTLSGFARWWIRRDRVDFAAEYQPETGQVTTTGIDGQDITVKVLRP